MTPLIPRFPRFIDARAACTCLLLATLLMAQGGCGDLDEDDDGWTYRQGDCNDGDAGVYPGADEVCDGLDNDCDGIIDTREDGDGDGHLLCAEDGEQIDCDDTQAGVYPGAEEVCDGVDNNCDGLIDNPEDGDGDGYLLCAEDDAQVDCDDTQAEVYPGAEEVCAAEGSDPLDNDCDGIADNPPDGDGDGYLLCAQPEVPADCDDLDAEIHPGTEELCDGLDNNCDGTIDEGLDWNTYYPDEDGDGFGQSAQALEACAQPAGYITEDGDCDDTENTVYPGAEEVCDDGDPLDNDCDGEVDEGFDLDGDGWTICSGGSVPADCDDTNAEFNPDIEEVCDGLDDDCSGLVDDMPDGDGDGVNLCAGDCDDTDSVVYPGASELCDGLDNDCAGEVDEGLTYGRWYVDASSQAPSPDGQSWERAFPIIEEAVAAAEASGINCPILWVAVGTYRASAENEPVLMMIRGLQVYGGFVGTESTLEARTGLYEETVLDGDYEPDGAFSDLDSKSVVYVYPDTVVDGFQIRGGNAMLSNSWGDGGGVWVGGMSAITLRNLHVIGNKGNMGGGLYSISTNALRLKDVVFEDNVALGGGGGMYVDGGNGIELEDCLFENNTAYGEYPEEDEGYFFPGGAGLDLQGPENVSLRRVVFDGNYVEASGGGLDMIGCNKVELSEVTFLGNQALLIGGGAKICDSSRVTLEDLWFEMNSANQGGGLKSYGGGVKMKDIVFLSNQATEVGGGISTYGPLLATRIRFVGNVADEGGGLDISTFEESRFNDIEFVDNEAYSGGGGLFVGGQSSGEKLIWYNNVTFVGNTAPEGAATFNENPGALLSITNAVFWSNTGSSTSSIHTAEGSTTRIQYSCFEAGDIPQGEGNLEMNSESVERVDLDSDGLDELILTTGSPCIDSGSDELANEAGDATDVGFEWWQTRSTATDCQPDLSNVDMGRHHALETCSGDMP